MERDDAVIEWLLGSGDPSLRFLTLTQVLGESADSEETVEARRAIAHGPMVTGLLSGQRGDGGFGVHPYRKWRGAHWRLVSLVELALPPGDHRAHVATRGVLDWLTEPTHHKGIRTINERTRAHASQEGNALAECSRLGLAADPRVIQLADSLVAWQWPDGGWNCDSSPECSHSSFYESLAPLWGLVEYHHATNDLAAGDAAERAAEFFLRHHLFRSERTGAVVNPRWLKLHYPLYWHYDILQGLLILGRLGKLDDPRTTEALDLLEQKRFPEGSWRPGEYFWAPPGQTGGTPEVVDWGRGGPNYWITLNALRVLTGAGRVG